MIVEFPLSEKQQNAYDTLQLERAIELVFGGGARGGKSYLGSFWIISECLRLPGSQWLVAREELKALKRTTLRTFFQVLKALKLQSDKDFWFNAQDMILTFKNDSVVFFAELKEIPSDPEFDRLGSYDLTGAWIDEAQEISKNAKDVLQFRFTVLRKNGWEAWPKSLYTCNPGKNWIYSDFWKPIIKDKKQDGNRYFITSLYTDNPEIDHEKYRESVLKTDNKVKIERLLYGNFEYDETPGRLCDYDAICEMFRRKVVEGEQYLTVDVAREGDDRSVVKRWRGFQVKQTWAFPENTIDELIEFVRDVCNVHLIPMENVVADAVGVGAGLVDVLRCKGYVGNRSAIQPKEAKVDHSKRLNFKDLNAQCGKMLADKINNGELGIDKTEFEELIKEELDNLLIDEPWADKPLALVPKDEIKAKIGRSPDFRDALMMRMYFELIPNESDINQGQVKTLNAMQSYLRHLQAR